MVRHVSSAKKWGDFQEKFEATETKKETGTNMALEARKTADIKARLRELRGGHDLPIVKFADIQREQGQGQGQSQATGVEKKDPSESLALEQLFEEAHKMSLERVLNTFCKIKKSNTLSLSIAFIQRLYECSHLIESNRHMIGTVHQILRQQNTPIVSRLIKWTFKTLPEQGKFEEGFHLTPREAENTLGRASLQTIAKALRLQVVALVDSLYPTVSAGRPVVSCEPSRDNTQRIPETASMRGRRSRDLTVFVHGIRLPYNHIISSRKSRGVVHGRVAPRKGHSKGHIKGHSKGHGVTHSNQFALLTNDDDE